MLAMRYKFGSTESTVHKYPYLANAQVIRNIRPVQKWIAPKAGDIVMFDIKPLSEWGTAQPYIIMKVYRIAEGQTLGEVIKGNQIELEIPIAPVDKIDVAEVINKYKEIIRKEIERMMKMPEERRKKLQEKLHGSDINVIALLVKDVIKNGKKTKIYLPILYVPYVEKQFETTKILVRAPAVGKLLYALITSAKKVHGLESAVYNAVDLYPEAARNGVIAAVELYEYLAERCPKCKLQVMKKFAEILEDYIDALEAREALVRVM